MDLIAKAVTLKSIKLSDPTANKLLFSAKHSVLYLFDSQSSSWVGRLDVRLRFKLNSVGKDGNGGMFGYLQTHQFNRDGPFHSESTGSREFFMLTFGY